MAGSYHYLVAGLPQMILDFESKLFDFESLTIAIKEQLSPTDRRWVDWLAFGLQPTQLSAHFYRVAATVKNPFIRDYFAFDLQLRNIQAAVLAKKTGQDPALFVVGSGELSEALRKSKAPDFGLRNQVDIAAQLFSILDAGNILEREQKLDQLRWDKAEQIGTFHYFDIETILGFLLKASIVKRWIALDKTRGQSLFKVLVQEVTGTYTQKKA